MSNLPSVGSLDTLEDVKNYIYSLERTLKYLLGGHLNSKNINELGGWLVGETDLSSQDGSVGMSAEETAGNDIRFWAGDSNKAIAPFRVLEDGTVIANKLQSKSVVTPTTITNTLTAQKAYIAELTVDELETSTKVQKYLVSDITDVNYIRVKGQGISWVTATVKAGLPTEQVTNRKGEKLYWEDATSAGVTLTVTSWPVMVYQYTEDTKRKISFESNVAGTYIPIDTIGAGTGTGDQGRAYIRKVTNGIEIEYIAEGTGASRKITLNDTGVFITPFLLQQLGFGLEADRPSPLNSVVKTNTFGSAGLGYRFSDKTFWSITTGNATIYKYSEAGVLLDSWPISFVGNGCEIDGDNDDFFWVTNGNWINGTYIEKWQISTKTRALVWTLNDTNGVCAPRGGYIYVGLNSPNRVVKVDKVSGAIVATYNTPYTTSDLAWDGRYVWVSYSDNSVVEAYDPANGFAFVRKFTGPYASHPGMTFDGTSLWVAYTDGGVVSKLSEDRNTPILYYATDTKKMYWNVNGVWTFVGGASTFTGLTDVPQSYTGQAGKVLAVNAGATALEFVVGGGSSGNATSIQGKPVPAPTASDTEKALVYDNASGAMKWSVPTTVVNASINNLIVGKSASTTIEHSAAEAFDGSRISTSYWASTNLPAWVKCDFGTTIQKQVSRYEITARTTYQNQAPKTWTFEGSNDDVNWTVLDTRSTQPNWGDNETRSYNITTPGMYKYYRLNVSLTVDGTLTGLSEITLYENPAQGDATSIQGKVVPIPASADDKKVLTYDSPTDKMKWTLPLTSSDASSITGVPVDASVNKSDGFVLTYDATSGKLLLKPKPSGSIPVYPSLLLPLSSVGGRNSTGLIVNMAASRVDNLQDPWYPKNLKVIQLPNTAYDMKVSWDRDAQSNITGYNVYLNGTLQNPSPIAQTTAGTNLTYTIVGVAKGTVCNISVKSIADGVEGFASTASITAGSAPLVAVMTSNTAPVPLVASAISEYSGLPAFKAFDGDTSTMWSSSGSPVNGVWLKIDLGAGNTYAPSAVDMRSRLDGWNTQAPKDFRFEGSNDDVTYSTIATFTGQVFAVGELKQYSLTGSTTYRYLRLWVTANNGDSNVSLCSLVWYG